MELDEEEVLFDSVVLLIEIEGTFLVKCKGGHYCNRSFDQNSFGSSLKIA